MKASAVIILWFAIALGALWMPDRRAAGFVLTVGVSFAGLVSCYHFLGPDGRAELARYIGHALTGRPAEAENRNEAGSNPVSPDDAMLWLTLGGLIALMIAAAIGHYSR